MGAERAVLALAGDQFGVVSAEQCISAGFSRNQIQSRLERGLWQPLGSGIYSVGPRQASADQLAMTALLTAGPEACLSHHSAAKREGITVPKPTALQVRVPWALKRNPPQGVTYWRSRSLDASDVMSRKSLRLTRVGRTLVDLSTVLTPVDLRVAFESALRVRRRNAYWIREVLDREGRGRGGTASLRRLLEEYAQNDEITDSELESFAMELGLATSRKPHLHHEVLEGTNLVAELDLAWPKVRLGVELDSWMFHSSKEAFQNDRARDRRLALLGWLVLRFTWRDVRNAPDQFIREIMAVYDARLQQSTN